MTVKTIDDVFGRMYNWKFEQAYLFAQNCPEFPPEAVKKLETLSRRFGNCGWCDGEAFNECRSVNNEVAALLGYRWDNQKDDWIKED